MKIMVTGGCGFIGSNFIRYLLTDPEITEEIKILNVDKITYAGQGRNIEHMYKESKNIMFLNNYRFVHADICDFLLIDRIIKKFSPDCIVNFAAESHNSYAILNPTVFFKTNLLGTQNLLEAARKNNVGRFHHISTCEVYGDLDLKSKKKFTETTSYKPNTPYNASKAAADLAVRAYFKTFNLPITISNCSNNYGAYQFPEKLIPLTITNILEGKKIPVYGDGLQVRDWLYVKDHCVAVDLVLRQGRIGETYCIGGGGERENIWIGKKILEI